MCACSTASSAIPSAPQIAVCPFDSGALWSGNTIKSGWTPDQKRAYFAEHDHPIRDGIDMFPAYVALNHKGDLAAYDRGDRPTIDIQEIVAVTGDAPEWPPWTWELRVEKERVHDVLSLTGIVWTNDSAARFRRWIDDDSGLDTPDAKELLALVVDRELRCGDDETPRQRAERAIMEWR